MKNGMKKGFVALAGALSAASFLSGCGDDITQITNSDLNAVASFKDLGDCDSKSKGRLVYVDSTESVYLCADSAWKEVNLSEVRGADGKDGANGKDGADGKDGANGKDGTDGKDGTNGRDGSDGKDGTSCTVEALDDSSGYDVLCGGEKVGELLNGKDGEKGDKGSKGDKGNDGKNCTVKVNTEKNGYDLICGDSVVTVTNGKDGKSVTGAKGESCTGKTLDNGNIQISCGGKLVGELKNGTPGAAGKSCTVQEDKEKDGYDLNCDGKVVTIANGKAGAEGKSAYDIAKEKDPTIKDVDEWLASLKGESGEGCTVEKVSNGVKVTCDGVSETITNVESSMFGSAKITTAASVSGGGTIQVTDVPSDPKNGLFFSCRFSFSEFTSLKIGKGYDTYRGAWIEITPSAIISKTYENSEHTVGSVNHGLTLSDYIFVSVSTGPDSKWHVVLNTSRGFFTTEFQLNYEFCGTSFATFGSAATSVNLAFGDSFYKRPVWLFGDSYVGIDNPARWPYYIKSWGYLNIMINGRAGRASAAAKADFEKALAFGRPKVVLWCMGMNDSDAAWLSNYRDVRKICEQNGIELILTTIPTTPTRNMETISEYVRNSGLRYIDFYKAVGANSSGEWYSGMLAKDNVHPTALGAEALAAQVLVDFPEIMQYQDN